MSTRIPYFTHATTCRLCDRPLVLLAPSGVKVPRLCFRCVVLDPVEPVRWTTPAAHK